MEITFGRPSGPAVSKVVPAESLYFGQVPADYFEKLKDRFAGGLANNTYGPHFERLEVGGYFAPNPAFPHVAIPSMRVYASRLSSKLGRGFVVEKQGESWVVIRLY